MAAVALAAVGMWLVAFPGLWATRAWSFAPSEWARIAVGAILAGLGSLLLGLALLALPTVLGVASWEHVVSACGKLGLGGPFLGWLAAGFTALLSCLVVRTLLRARRGAKRARIEPWVGCHYDHGDHELVIVPTAAPLALGVEGSPPQVIVSAGLVADLEKPLLDAIIGHEVAHLRLRHRRYLLLATVAEHALGVFPFVRRSCDVLRDAIEQWADERSSEAVPERAAVLTSALVTVAGSGTGTEAAALPRQVRARAARLRRRPPRATALARLGAYVGAGALGVSAMLFVSDWVVVSHHAIAIGGHCA